MNMITVWNRCKYQNASNMKKCTPWMATLTRHSHVFGARLKSDEIPASTECGGQGSAENMLNPMMPEDVAVTKIPRQSWKSWPEIFGFTQFQGLAIARRLHLVAQVLNVAFWVLVLVNTFPSGNPGQIIAAIIICPIMLLVFACFYRLLSEITVSILLIPALLVKQQAAVGGNAGPQTNDADLAAYGVGGHDDMGTVV